jgi:hypothetical protein
MTTRQVIVRLHWRTPAEGGRHIPPTGQMYSTVAAFDPPTPNWPHEAWSVVVEPVPTANSPQCTLRFLADLAPHHVLQPGVRFELLEGARVVADGEVIDDAMPVAAQ